MYKRQSSVYGISDQLLEDWDSLRAVADKDFPVLDDRAGEQMRQAILEAKDEQDSVGGAIECAVFGLPAGLGGPDFGENAEGIFSQYLFAVPAVKAVGFGAGAAFALMRGSEANDPLYMDDDGAVRAEQNCAGGINGGITNGMPLVFEVTMRPTPVSYTHLSSFPPPPPGRGSKSHSGRPARRRGRWCGRSSGSSAARCPARPP